MSGHSRRYGGACSEIDEICIVGVEVINLLTVSVVVWRKDLPFVALDVSKEDTHVPGAWHFAIMNEHKMTTFHLSRSAKEPCH